MSSSSTICITRECSRRSPGVFQLPDLLPQALLEGTCRTWPCKTDRHALEKDMGIESLDWVKSFGIMSDDKIAKFARYEIMTLVAWAYRRSTKDHFRLCSDFMHLFWIIDDLTDEQSSLETECQVTRIKRILEDPGHTSPDDGILENICKSWWNNVLDKLNPPTATKNRFLRDFISYLESLPEEARDRETGRLRSRSEHFDLRRRTGGLLPSFDFIYIPSHLSDHVVDHEVIKRMTITTGDLVIIANDVYSYNVEQAGGQKRVAHNFVDVILRERRKGLQDAMDVVGKIYRDLFLLLVDDYNNLPTFEDAQENRVLEDYVSGLLDWVEANVEFSLSSHRYFGSEAGLEKMRINRMVKLLPQKR